MQALASTLALQAWDTQYEGAAVAVTATEIGHSSVLAVKIRVPVVNRTTPEIAHAFPLPIAWAALGFAASASLACPGGKTFLEPRNRHHESPNILASKGDPQ
jgi:hypothetical protein